MIVRIRTQLGTWRLKEVQSTDSIGTLRQRVEEEHMTDLCGRPLTRDPAGLEALPNELTVAAAKVGNGDMLYAMIDEAKTGVHELAKTKRSITKDGNIIALDYHSNAAQTGFRPGMLPLKSMKMQWTLNEFMSLDEQFIYKMKRQDEAICKGVSLDNASIGGFVKYMANFDYQKIRVGYLYGYFEDDNKVKVECIYEPPQETTDKQFTLLEDPLQERVEKVALSLGLRRVGWVYSHPPREKGFFMSALEVLTAGELQLESAGGVEKTSFVTVKVSLDEEGNTVVEGYQVSLQCMEMVAEGVLELTANMGVCKVNPTFTAVQEGKNTNEVDNNFFLNNVPIARHESITFVATFPPLNREVMPTQEDLKRQLSKAGTSGWTMQDVLSDFNLLLFVCEYLDVDRDVPAICASLLDREVPLYEGHQLLLRMIAGLDD